MKNDVIVIGAGIGGMNAAIQLASKGYRVSIFEKNQYVGGKMRRIVHEQCTFDAGPSLITMPFILQNAIESLPGNRSLNDYLELIPIDPICDYHWEDGTAYRCYADSDKRNEETARIFGEPAVDEMRDYLHHAGEVYKATKDVFLFNRFEGFKEFFKTKNLPLLPQLPSLKFTKIFHDFNASYFTNPKLIQLFDRFATYNGSSPYLAPATLMVIPFIEFEFGGWYPNGGIYSIAEAFHKICNELNIPIHLGEDVQEILVKNNQAYGIRLQSGETIHTDNIIANGDVYHTRKQLLQKSNESIPPLSSSGFVILIAMKENPFLQNHHTILFSNDHQREFEQIFSKGMESDDMTIYISASSITDSSQSLDGLQNWFVLVNTPAREKDFVWSEEKKQSYAQSIIERMKKFYPAMDTYISGEPLLISPDDFSREFHALGGSLYGSSSNSMFSAFLRPKNRDKNISNLYYCGGSAHPGGGVPLVILSGEFAAQEVLDNTKSFK